MTCLPRATRKKLKILRLTKELRQQDVANAVGVSKFAVYCWEKGKRNPSSAHLAEWRKFLA